MTPKQLDSCRRIRTGYIDLDSKSVIGTGGAKQGSGNCYACAIDDTKGDNPYYQLRINPYIGNPEPFDNEYKTQPGGCAGIEVEIPFDKSVLKKTKGTVEVTTDYNSAAEQIVAAAKEDAKSRGTIFQEYKPGEEALEGAYLVALVIFPGKYDETSKVAIGYDYHWYRQNKDGTWSHKPRFGPVLDTDGKGDENSKIIENPRYADRSNTETNEYGWTTGVDYSIFVGYYYVR